MEVSNTSSTLQAHRNKILFPLFFIIFLFVLTLVALGAYSIGVSQGQQSSIEVIEPTGLPAATPDSIEPTLPTSPEGEGVVCTMDALLCPDGSAVGRSGPNCEFAPCPTPQTQE